MAVISLYVKGNFFAVLALMGVSCANASNMEIPYSFTPGTPAKAEEVNGNFSSAKSAIDDNYNAITGIKKDLTANRGEIDNNRVDIGNLKRDISELQGKVARLPMLVDSSGRVMGYIVGWDDGSWNPSKEFAIVMLPYGDHTILFLASNDIVQGWRWHTRIYYDQAGCAGNAYASSLDVTAATATGLNLNIGNVGPDQVLYLADTSLPQVMLTVYSFGAANNSCQDMPSPETLLLYKTKRVVDFSNFDKPYHAAFVP